MDAVELKVKKRVQIGGARPKQLLKEKIVSGVVYGCGMESCPVQVGEKELIHALHTSAGDNVLINLFVDDAKKPLTVIIAELQKDVIRSEIMHVDFRAIDIKEKVEVEVPLHHMGDSIGVKQGGIFDMHHSDIEIECLPTAIPERINVDISAMDIGDILHVSDLVLPEGVVCLMSEDTALFGVLPPRVSEEEEGEEGSIEGEEAAAGAEPQIIKKGKGEEDSEK